MTGVKNLRNTTSIAGHTWGRFRFTKQRINNQQSTKEVTD